jgi:hypothetical protein
MKAILGTTRCPKITTKFENGACNLFLEIFCQALCEVIENLIAIDKNL